MSRFQFREVCLENYRCFDGLTLALEEDTTVLFAENGGGKTALLTALATGLAALQIGTGRRVRLDARRDPKMRTLDEKGRREPTGQCRIEWTAAVGELEAVTWSAQVLSLTRGTRSYRRPVVAALEKVQVSGERWPLFAWYGVDRMGRQSRRRKVERKGDRWEAYDHALDPNLDETMLLLWLQDEMLGDAVRRRQQEPERFFDAAVMEATARATRGVANAWYDPAERGPKVRFEDGHVASWSELSDGYHVFIALVADVARRAVMLNGFDGAEAPVRVEGVVLIDELDLHLHPDWQRVALPALREAFPRLQFVVSTHSPQVLSSAKNRQVRRLVDGELQEEGVFVSGRDTNAILRDHMNTDDRDDEGVAALDALHEAIDRGDWLLAKRLHEALVERWGFNDPALIRARGFMEE